MMKTTACLLLALMAHYCSADIYMQMPRGSNNRLDEANRDRANANRLFDSQNNNRGGYNVGSTYYTQGSTIYMSWTNQHSCGAGSNECELVIQYMCDAGLRDGTTTQRIPTDNDDCYLNDCDNDLEYGRQESWQWYKNCTNRERNQGLFVSNQNLQGESAQYTRQNPNGNRYGYECPEERDYYPYWYPTAWRDVAILTNSPTRCASYIAESENVKGRWYCDPPAGMLKYRQENNQAAWLPLDKEACEALYWVDDDTQETTWGLWRQSKAHNVPPPTCTQNKWTRDNHLGDQPGAYNSMFNFTAPTGFTNDNCIFRLRYNITTYEYDPFDSAESVQGGTDASSNADVLNNANRYPANVDVWSEYGLSYDDVEASFNQATNGNTQGLKASREYVLRNNPNVDIFGSLLTGNNAAEAKLQLNINTNQFGRTFQDRSHRWELRPASANCAGLVTHNLQVRGKRGNIVQTYPGTEYDFVPEHLNMAEGECIHIQWTGSDSNPNNNAGQGRQGTDRSNIVQLRPPVYTETDVVTDPPKFGQFGMSYPADIRDESTAFLGFSKEDQQKLAILDSYSIGGELSELDDAGPYFDLGPKKVTKKGVYHYMSTRNNNFSNRSQKGKITVTATASTYSTVGWEGGKVEALNGVSVVVPEGELTAATSVVLSTTPGEAVDQKTKSDFLQVSLAGGKAHFSVNLPYDRKVSFSGKKVMHNYDANNRDLTDRSWSKVRNVEYKNGVASFEAESDGVYVVVPAGLSLWAAILLLILLLAGGVLLLVCGHMVAPDTVPDVFGDVCPDFSAPTFTKPGAQNPSFTV